MTDNQIPTNVLIKSPTGDSSQSEIAKVLDKFAQEAEYKDWADLERSEFMWYPDTHERLVALAVSETRKEMIAEIDEKFKTEDFHEWIGESYQFRVSKFLDWLKTSYGAGQAEKQKG